MYITELKVTVFSIINKNDPWKASKEVYLKNWCYAFLKMFSSSGASRLKFFLDVLSDEECWDKIDTIHGIKLNRRLVAKKMLEKQSWKGTKNPLDEYDRYQVACWCSLQENIVAIFEDFKRQREIVNNDPNEVKNLVQSMSTATWSDASTSYWSHVVGGCVSDLPLGGKHLYEYGLDLALDMNQGRDHKYRGHVEAVEFFWNKIKALPDGVLSDQQKNDIFIMAAVRAASSPCCDHPDIFEFCINEISLDLYPEFLKREFLANSCYGSFVQLQNMMHFDIMRTLFDCLDPQDVTDDDYWAILTSLRLESYYPKHFANQAVNLLMHIWRNDAFVRQRDFAIKLETCGANLQGSLLVPLTKKNYMDAVFAMLNTASLDQIHVFMNSEAAEVIRTTLENGNKKLSLSKFLNYNFLIAGIDSLSISR